MKKKAKRRFKKDEAALVFSPDGGVTMQIPKTDPVPDYVLTAVLLGIMLSRKDKELAKLIRKQEKVFRKLAKQEERNENQ
jgi:hypothetical protein